MIALKPDALRRRAEGVADELREQAVAVELKDGYSTVGGGSLPGELLPTTLISLRPKSGSVTRLAERLRRGEPPVIGRIESGALVLDLRPVLAEETDELCRALKVALQ
jgi:L-seryl-tRNA(Ser) seleniumtransferase